MRSRFKLRCRGDRWELVLSGADGAGAAETVLAGPADGAHYEETGQHLAVTVNAVSGTVRLYVDGEPAATGQLPAATWNGTVDRLVAGRGLGSDGSGTTGGHLSGDMDEIRVYAGELSSERVQQIASRTPLPDQ